MKKIIWLIAACMIFSAVCANAREVSQRALAEELLNVTGAREFIEKPYEIVKQLPAQAEKMKQANGQSDASADGSSRVGKMKDIIDAELSWSNIKDDYITLYAEAFTVDEMKGIIAFHKTSVGRIFVKKQPELMKRIMALNKKKVRIMPKIFVIKKIYNEVYTADERKGINAFYESPVGKVFTKKQSELTKRSTELGKERLMRIMPEIRALQDELKQTPSQSSVRKKTGK